MSSAGTVEPTMAGVTGKAALLCRDPRLNSHARDRRHVITGIGCLAAGCKNEAVWRNLVNVLLSQTPPGMACCKT